MSRLPGLYQGQTVVGKRFAHLSKPMAVTLALWSLGMIIARSGSLTAIAWALVPIRKEKFYSHCPSASEILNPGHKCFH